MMGMKKSQNKTNRVVQISDEELDDFLIYLKDIRKYSEHTVISYGEDIADFLLFLKKDDKSKSQVEKETIRLFLLELTNRKLSHTSIKRYLAALRHFYKYLYKYKGYDINPFITITSPKKEKKLPAFLSNQEMIEFLDANEKRTDFLKLRDQAILELMFSSGLRASEVINAKISDFDFSQRTLKVLGKGNKERIVPFGRKAKDCLLLYLKENRHLLLQDKKDNGFIFLSNHGEQLSERGLEHIISNCAFKAGFSLKVHPHMIRHSFATYMLNNGMDLRMLQELLGHSSIATTAIYTHISLEDLKKTYDECFPKIFK